MKGAWLGAGIGIAIGVAALYIAGGHRSDAPKLDEARATIAIEVGTCDARMSRLALDYDTAAKELSLADPAAARTVLEKQIQPVFDSRIATCMNALALVQKSLSGSDGQMKVAEQRLTGHVARLRTIKNAYNQLATSLGSAELAALSASVH